MKRALFIFLIIASVLCLMASCGDNTTQSSAPTAPSEDTQSSVSTAPSEDTQSSVPTAPSEDTQSSVPTVPSEDTQSSVSTVPSEDTQSSVPTVPSTDTQSSVPTVPSTDTQSSTVAPPSDDDEPPAPSEPSDDDYEDETLNLACDGVSEYIVVYDDSEPLTAYFAKELVEYIKSQYSIELECEGLSIAERYERKIVIGDNGDIERVKSRLDGNNDLAMCVRGRDYVLYSSNPMLYGYMLELMKKEILPKIREGMWVCGPEDDFILHTSAYKDKSYYDYVMEKNNGQVNYQTVKDLFMPFTFKASDKTTSLPVRIYVPYNYDPDKSYPVLTLLHGAGERGSNNESQLVNMVTNLFKLQNSPMWESIVICPQCPSGEQWVDTPWENGGYMLSRVKESNENKAVMELLDLIEQKFSTDTSRYYVAGLSMGGFGTWDLMMRHPERFAGAVPLCGGADYFQAKNLVNKPIYTIHGTNDTSVPISGTQQIADALKTYGSTVFFYEKLEGYGHNVWDYASQKAEIWSWLYSQDLDEQQ